MKRRTGRTRCRGTGEITQPRYGTAATARPHWGGMSSPRPRIVIVDDHAVFRQVARELLEECGYIVLGEADCAAAAHEVVARSAPDLVIVDIRLGDECGFDLARALTRSHPSLAVLLTSTDPDAGDPDRVRASGARGFLPKARLATLDPAMATRRTEMRLADFAATFVRSWRHGAPGLGRRSAKRPRAAGRVGGMVATGR